MPSKNKKAVLFDLDGTVLDTINTLADAINRSLASLGFGRVSVDEVLSFIGDGTRELVKRALGGSDDAALVKEAHMRFSEEYRSHLFDGTKPYDGIKALLDSLAVRGIACGIVSNKDDDCVQKLISHFFGDSFAYCRGVRVSGDRKPSVSTTLEVLQQLGVSAGEALFVGDGMTDLKTAYAAGIDFVPVGYGYGNADKLFAESGTAPAATVSELAQTIFACLKQV